MSTVTHVCAHTHRVRFILGNKLQTASKIVCCPFISGPFATPQKFLALLGIQIHSPLTPALSQGRTHFILLLSYDPSSFLPALTWAIFVFDAGLLATLP